MMTKHPREGLESDFRSSSAGDYRMDSENPTVDALRQLYREMPIAKAFLDHAARRERDQSETKVDRLLIILKANGHNVRRREVIDLFRQLQEQRLGQFVEGRRGWPSRFVWNTSITSVGRAAIGMPGIIEHFSIEENAFGASPETTDSASNGEESGTEDSGDAGNTGLEEEDTGGSFEITEPFDPARIRVDTKPMVISLLMDRVKNKEIDLTPGFQRKGGIWSTKAKSQLIESLLIRIPLPAFYMDGGDESKWLVVDGLQRLSTLKSFVIDKTLILNGLEFLSEYEGKTFDQLPRSLQRRILETQVTVFLIQENTPPEVKFNIFKRINTGGLPLSSQEIRHALHQGKATQLLQELSESAEFRTATNEGIRDERMGDRECILRLLSFMRTPYREYRSKNLDSFLNQCMIELNDISDPEIEFLGDRFKRAMLDCYRLFRDHAFRKQKRDNPRRSPVNRALFEVWAASIDILSPDQVAQLEAKKEELHERFLTLLEDGDFEAAITYGTGDSRKVRLRFSKIEEIIQETLR
jgi:Protein of unknown function DUF262